MSRFKASLLLDPRRREAQLAFVRERVTLWHEYGDQLWTEITEEQADSFAERGIVVQFDKSANLVLLPAVMFDPAEEVPEPPEELMAVPPTGDETAYFLVQFNAPPSQGWLGALEELGATYVDEMELNVSVFQMTAQQATDARDLYGLRADENAGERETEAFIRWMGLYHPAYAVSFQLMQSPGGDSARPPLVASADEMEFTPERPELPAAILASADTQRPLTARELRSMRVEPTLIHSTGTGTLEVAFFANLSTAEMRPLVEAAGATVVTDTGHSLVIDLRPEQLQAVLRVPGVRAVDPHFSAQLDNQRAGMIMAANEVRRLGNVNFLVNLDGTGEIVGILDTGLDNGNPATLHTDFMTGGAAPSRVLAILNINPPPGGVIPPGAFAADYRPHGTHVAGSIAGDGFNAPPPPPPPAPGAPALPPGAANRTVPRGIAPRAQIVFHSVNAGLPPAPGAQAPLNYNLFLTAFQQAYDRGARIHSNSWHTPNTNIYTPTGSRALDEFAFLHPDMLILSSSGNSEDDLNNDGVLDMNTLGEEPVAKNTLVVGASENETRLDGRPNDYRTTFGAARWPNAAFNPLVGAPPPIAPPPFFISDSANQMALFSCRGLVNDPVPIPRRRVRPDVVAPGTNIMSTGPRAMLPFAVPRGSSTAPAAFYYMASGTSMATPLTAGACTLVRQFYRTRFTQLRRPVLIEAFPTVAPPVAYVDAPSACAHRDGCLLAWVRPDAAAGPNNIRAARYSRQLARVGNVEQLEPNVGTHPAITVERLGDHTLLVFRASDNTVRISHFDDQLHRVNTFGTNGTLTLAPASRDEADRRPTLCVQGNVAAVAWVQTGTDNLVFQRLRADTGAPSDATPKTLGVCTNTSTHPYVLHNGDRYAAAWARLDGANHKVHLRFINTTGAPVGGANPLTLVTQPQAIRDVHLCWDARLSQYVLVWVGENTHAGGDIYALRVRADGTANGTPTAVLTVPAASAVRRPRIATHPESGYTLTWEDNTQGGTFDLNLAFLSDADIAAGTITGTRLQISDTPQNTGGFASLTDAEGVLPFWQSNDEINSDMLGLFALNVTKAGVFDLQRDAAALLLENGHYTRRLLLEHNAVTLLPVAAAWAGGDMFHLRLTEGFIFTDLKLVHLSADGKPDATWGGDGSKVIDTSFGCSSASLFWTGRRLVAGYSWSLASRLLLLDGDGNLDTTFNTNGILDLADAPTDSISIQLGHLGTGAAARIFAVYGRRNVTLPHTIRFTAMKENGATTGANTTPPRNLVPARGTAKQGWFHVLSTETPARFIAAWHSSDAGSMIVLLNRFQLNGTPQPGFASHIRLTLSAAVAGNPQTPLPGDSQNAVIAPRPIFSGAVFPLPAGAAVNARRREFGVAWQYRPAAAAPWEIRFSRLNRNGTVRTSVPNPAGGAAISTQNVQVFASATLHGLDPQLVWHTDGYGLAWLQQPVAGGVSKLFFTVLDENGARVQLPGLGAAGAAGAVADFALSEDAADVKSFQLIWNGRSFRITWTEILNGKIRHMQSALSVPRAAGGAQYDDPYKHPTAALIRATVINGATNFNNTSLPNVPSAVAPSNANDGYGWGRVNLRQALSPVPPVTFHVRDDSTVAAGRTARYEFRLEDNTALLRVTLVWTDLPGNNIVNQLALRVTAPGAPPRIYVGNRWQTTPLVGAPPVSGPPFSDPLPAVPPVNPFEDIHNVQQVVIARPPAGLYVVEVIGRTFGTSPFMPLQGQPFALVFTGSGPEIRTGLAPGVAPPAGPIPFY